MSQGSNINVQKRILLAVTLLLMSIGLVPTSGQAEVFRLAILHGDVDVFDYEIGVVKLALEHADGDHQLELVLLQGTPQDRLLLLMEEGREINVFFTGHSPERESQYLQVDFPMTRGLLGNRIFITRPDVVPALSRVKTLDDLKEFAVGSGTDWPDTKVFRENGFNVVASSYANLWNMLENNRFDIFNRGLHEAFVEIKQQQAKGRDLVIDQTVQVIYPFDYFLYVNRDDHVRRDILQQGLERAQKNGAFGAYFNNHPMIKQVLDDSKVTKRTQFVIGNPGMSQRLLDLPAEYWQVF